MRRIVTVSMVALLLVGCGPKRPKTGVVTGTVKYKGQPVNDAALLLYPAGGGADAAPITISVTHEGEFHTFPDTPAGEYTVVVQGSAGASEAPNLKYIPPEKMAEVKEKLAKMSGPRTIQFPNKYKDRRTTDLKCTVTDKDQSMDLELKD